MKKLAKNMISLVSLVLLLNTPCGLAQEKGPAGPVLQEVEGIAGVIDWAGSFLVLELAGDDITLRITEKTKFIRNGEEADFSDINDHDRLSVVYYMDSSGEYVAVRITMLVPAYSP